jgi:hypothetical protein
MSAPVDDDPGPRATHEWFQGTPFEKAQFPQNVGRYLSQVGRTRLVPTYVSRVCCRVCLCVRLLR